MTDAYDYYKWEDFDDSPMDNLMDIEYQLFLVESAVDFVHYCEKDNSITKKISFRDSYHLYTDQAQILRRMFPDVFIKWAVLYRMGVCHV